MIVAIAIVLFSTAVIPASLAQQQEPADAGADGPSALSLWRVQVTSHGDIDFLVNHGYDLMEYRGDDYLVVLGEPSVALQLRAAGFAVSRETDLAPLPPLGRGGLAFDAQQRDEIELNDYYGGFMTVDEHYAYLAEVATEHPELVRIIDYGDSWLKVNGEPDGNDLMAICITEMQPGDCVLDPDEAKPRAVIMAAIHARELQTSEMAWRLIDELINGFDSDPEITEVLSTTEVWIIPVVNPDGREIAEGGGNTPYMQRKNANDTQGDCSLPPTTSNHHGVDLNRNASFGWGGDGVSDNPCAQTWPGTSPASEPEQAALEDLFDDLWVQRSPDDNPDSITGTFITIHSFGELILLPFGNLANAAGLNAWAFRMSHYNNYVTGPAESVLYAASGTTDDYVYNTFGVPSSTYELSARSGSCGGFAPQFSCLDALWDLNRDALLYSIKVAGAPNLQSQGPTVTAAEVSIVGAQVQVSADIDDNTYGDADGSIGRPTAAPVVAARYFIDLGPLAGGSGVAMQPVDGAFNETGETATATISTEGLSAGSYRVLVQAQNANGFWGPLTAGSFTLQATGDVDQNGTIDSGDVQAILSLLAGKTGNIDQIAADMNRDGNVTLLDALMLAQMVAALPDAEQRSGRIPRGQVTAGN